MHVVDKNSSLFFSSPKDKALFNPKDYLAAMKLEHYTTDIGVIFFSNKIGAEIQQKLNLDITHFDPERPKYESVRMGKKKVLFIRSGPGSPCAGALLEEIIALGAKKIFFVGSTGALQDCPIGSLIIPTRAIREEGTSYHYASPTSYAHPSKLLTKKLATAAQHQKITFAQGTTWTTDAPYRETITKVNAYHKKGVMCVEMEAAALFTIAHYRKVAIAGIFWVSDQVHTTAWKPHFNTNSYFDGAKAAYAVLHEVLLKETH